MAKIMIDLELPEREALITLAQRERRDPRDQAALFVRDGLQRAGLLPTDTTPPTTQITAQGAEHAAR
jgi:hypothetical protein